MSVVDFNDAPFYKGLHYGPPGSYKTRLAYSAALIPGMKVLGLNSSGNPYSIRDYENLPLIINMEKLSDYNFVYKWLADGQPRDPRNPFYKKYEEFLDPPYNWVNIDQITDTQRMSFDVALGRADSLAPGDMPAAAHRQTFGAVLAQMTTFARLFYNLPMNVVINALEREPAEGRLKYGPLLLGQAAQEVASYAYVVARMMHRQRVRSDVTLSRRLKDELTEEELAEVEAVMMLVPSPTWEAKDQYAMGRSYIVNPSMAQIMELIVG